jgi:peptidyl-prolyl cis-trans isomerase B (cyclophilin B)
MIIRHTIRLSAILWIGLGAWWMAPAADLQQTKTSQPEPKPAASIKVEELKDLQAVIETDHGVIVLEFFLEAAPQHVAYFVQLARDGFFNGTTFHRVLPNALIQGGDPLSRNLRTPRVRLGTGGLDKLKPEFNDRPFFRGTVGAVLRPNEPNSAGSQFFICATDQTQLTKQYTAFGRVVEGFDVVEKISQVPVDDNNLAKERVVMKSVTIRPAVVLTGEELKQYRVVLETSLGNMAIEFLPDAPRHASYFLKLAGGGFYDGTTFHIIMPNYILQGGDPMTRGPDRAYWGQGWSGEWLPAEFNKVAFERGTVGMMLMRRDDPNSATCQFFICLARAAHLDGKYTAFGKVVEGMEVLDQIAALKTDEKKAPVEPVVIRKFRVVRVAQPGSNSSIFDFRFSILD